MSSLNYLLNCVHFYLRKYPQMSEIKVDSISNYYIAVISDFPFFNFLANEFTRLNSSTKDIIKVYEKFLSEMKKLIDIDINFTVNSRAQALHQILKINNKNTVCSNFFNLLDLSKFTFTDVIEILKVAQNSEIKYLSILSNDNKIYSPAINCFFNNKDVTERLKKDITTFLDSNTDLYGNFSYHPGSNEDFFRFNYKYSSETMYDFSDTTKNYICQLREILAGYFENFEGCSDIQISVKVSDLD